MTSPRDLPIAHLLKKFGDDNPPTEPKLAIPTLTVRKIAKKYNFSDHHRAVADLCIIAFVYLLQVGEYTTPTSRKKRRKCMIRSAISAFGAREASWTQRQNLQHYLLQTTEPSASQIQRTGMKGAVVHHKAIGGNYTTSSKPPPPVRSAPLFTEQNSLPESLTGISQRQFGGKQHVTDY